MREMPPAPAARVVVTAARATMPESCRLAMRRALPGLKPYHPNHNRKVPSTTLVLLVLRKSLLTVESADAWANKVAAQQGCQAASKVHHA